MIALLLTKITFYNILTQAIGVLAMCVAIVSFQAKKSFLIIIFQTVSSTLWMIHFLMLSAYTGAILNGVIVIRNIVYAFHGKKKWASNIIWVFVFSAAIIAVSIFTWKGIISILPMLGSICTTISFYIINPQKLRIVSFVSSPLWLVYDALNRSYPGVITEVFVMISIIIALIRYSKKKEDTVKTV